MDPNDIARWQIFPHPQALAKILQAFDLSQHANK